ncbi:MAG TPA: hypothetical protein VFZ49_03800 [Pyrinomonadaceae bacterium]
MKRLNLPTLTLMALTGSSLIMSGAQLFAVSIIASTVSKAPPRSFAIFSGEYAYDSRAFWDVVPTIVFVLFLVAVVTNWKTPRRNYVLAALGLFVLSGFIAFLYLEPTFDAMIAQGFSDHVDPVMQRNAATWYMVDWASWCVLFAASLTLLFALVQPTKAEG